MQSDPITKSNWFKKNDRSTLNLNQISWFQVLDKDANMTTGSYAPTLARINAMAYTHAYSKSLFIFAFLESNQLATPLAKLMTPFQGSVWILIAFLVSFSIFAILMTKRLSTQQRHFIIGGRMNRTPVLNMMSVLIGNVISNPIIMEHEQYFGVFARSLFMLWIFFWLIVRSSYQGSLYESLQNQRAISLYDTVEKVRMSNVRIGITGTGLDLIPDGFDRNRYWITLKRLPIEMNANPSFATDLSHMNTIHLRFWTFYPAANIRGSSSLMMLRWVFSIQCKKFHAWSTLHAMWLDQIIRCLCSINIQF